jgi:hypothetical protein
MQIGFRLGEFGTRRRPGMAPPPSNYPPEVIQIVIGILVMSLTAIAALVRRLDRWLREHYSSRPGIRPGERPGAPSGTPPPAPRRPVAEEEDEDPQTVLIRELERALGVERRRPAAPEAPRGAGFEWASARPVAGEQTASGQATTGSASGRPSPAGGAWASGPSAGGAMAGQAGMAGQTAAAKQAAMAGQAAMAPPPPVAATRQPPTLPPPSVAPRPVPHFAASVSRRRFGHLALLHSPTDLRNAVVLTEILGKPACYRRLGWRFPR